MKEVVVISGKGGAGKTTFSAALNLIAENNVCVDTDVEAANLGYLVGFQENISHEKYFGMNRAYIDPALCINCGDCEDVCEFHTIFERNDVRVVNTPSCEGCATCTHVCPVTAISMIKHQAGEINQATTSIGKPLFQANLSIGEENTGMLVEAVRDRAQKYAENNNYDWLIVDGPPGTGCPTTSAITGSDFVIVVVEASVSGVADFIRTLDLIDNFRIRRAAVINKYDINPEMTAKIEEICENRVGKVPILGRIPYSKQIQEALANEQTIIAYAPNSEISNELYNIWNQLQEVIDIDQMQFDVKLV